MTLLLHGSHAAVKMDLRLVERSPALEFGTYRPRPRVILVDHWSRGFVVWSSNHAHRAWAEGGMFVVSESIWTQCSDMNNCTEESELYWVSLTETNTTKHNFLLFFVLLVFILFCYPADTFYWLNKIAQWMELLSALLEYPQMYKLK